MPLASQYATLYPALKEKRSMKRQKLKAIIPFHIAKSELKNNMLNIII